MVVRSSEMGYPGTEIDSLGLEQFWNNDGTCHWQGSAFNVRDPAVDCCEQSGVYCVFLCPRARVLCVCERQLPTTTVAKAPICGPTPKQAREWRLLR